MLVNLLKKYIYPYIILNIILSYFFIGVVLYLGLSIDHDIAFATPDSKTYYEVGKWLYDGTPTEYLSIRPFLFPFILYSSISFLGIKGYFVFQFIFWLGSANLLFATLNKLFHNTVISAIGIVLLVSNLSFVMITFHALSEVFVMFLITFFIFMLTHWIDNTRKDKAMLLMLFVLVLLTVTKPVFFYFAVLSAIIIIPILFYKYKYYKKSGKMLKLFLIFIPLFFQMGIMKVNYNTFNVSTIGSETFKLYLFQRSYAIENNLNTQIAIEKVRKMSDPEVIAYILEHKISFIKTYFLNLKENIHAYSPPYLEYKRNINTGGIIYEGNAGKYMYALNSIYYYLHIVVFFAVLFKIIRIFYKKEFNNWNICLVVLSFIFYSFLFSNAISCFEGDRLTLPTLPIWIVLYSMLVFQSKPRKLFEIKSS